MVPSIIQSTSASHSQPEKLPGTNGISFINTIAKPTNAPNRAIALSAIHGFIP